MALKKFAINDDLIVTVYKRRGSRSLRLSIAGNGEVRVTMPFWAPYKAGVAFAQSRLDWIAAQRVVPDRLKDGLVIGKNFTLRFKVSIRATKVSSRIMPPLVIVTRPLSLPDSHQDVQLVAEKAAIRALRQEATALLPKRLSSLAQHHGFTYEEVTIKQLTGRWGSCDTKRRIALNLFLMQLPWELIDYVLIHELIHTEHLHHGPAFWSQFEQVLPNAKHLRTIIRKHKPVVLR